MKVYSPSQTVSWLRCPILRMLQQEGWRSRWIGKRDMGAVLGQAFGAGVEAHYAKLATPPADVARAVAEVEVKALTDAGCQWYEGEEGQARVLPTLASKAVVKYIERDPMPAGWEVLCVQQEMPEAGNARLDLGVRNHAGQLGLIDLKFKRTLKSEYRQQTIDELLTSWQFKHYAHFFGERMKEEVAFWVLCLTVMEPRFEVIWRVAPRDDEMLERWVAGAKGAWAMMEKMDRGEIAPWEAAEHRTQYGRCEMYEACFEYRLEEGLMRGQYVREAK